ncbi:hypothetical protein [Nocardioides stalactiti]|uniref:hypothetical protein n=1 Tax=Nocardioides stalactiti TaxID=2755356 RepID=UPI0016003344|nr:hypothetical protein [Nocardioides stalactiti]
MRRLLLAAGLVGAAGVTIPAVLMGGGGEVASWTPKPEPLTGGAVGDAAAACRASIGAHDTGERVAVAERRGEWTFVLLTGKAAEVVCLMPDEAIGGRARGGDDVFGAYNPGDATPAALGADTLVEGRAMSSSTSEGWFTWTTGYVGNEVAGVTVHTSSGLDIEASVVGNRFAAWWPDDGESWTYTVHLVDGSTRPLESGRS